MTFFFTPWFLILGTGVALGRAAGMDLSNQPFWVRVSINFAYLASGIALTILVKSVLSIP